MTPRSAAIRSAKARRCPACHRLSALVRRLPTDPYRHVCRWCGHDTDLAPDGPGQAGS